MSRRILWRLRPNTRKIVGLTLFLMGTVLALTYIPFWAWLSLFGLLLAAAGLSILKDY